MRLNTVKSLWTLEELGWRLYPPGDGSWDGMTGWFLEYARYNPRVIEGDSTLRGWYSAASSHLAQDFA
jgi:hypothetical protein